MNRCVVVGVGVPALCLATTPGRVASRSVPSTIHGIVIEHQGASCVVADRFPRFEARLNPPENVAKARLYFRPDGGVHWYSVVMTAGRPEGVGTSTATFYGAMPKPKKSLRKFDYYIEVLGTDGESSRTEEFSPAVVGGLGACQDTKVAAALRSASVLVELPAGAKGLPAVPSGFSAAGVVAPAGAGVATGGGISATKLALGGLGAAAAAGVAIVATKDEAATPRSLAGQWRGTLTEVPGYVCRQEHELRMSLAESGGTVTGEITLIVSRDIDGTGPPTPPSGCQPIGLTSNGSMSNGRHSGDTVSLPFNVGYFYLGVVTLTGSVAEGGRSMSGSATVDRGPGYAAWVGTFGTWVVTKSSP